MKNKSKIIVIDDDPYIRGAIRIVLQKNGYEVIEAGNGDEGLSLHKEKRANLVITDIIMPKKEGLETIREFKRDFPGVKIMAISGGGRAEPNGYLTIAREMGADFTLMKPFENEQLLEAVIKLMGN